MGSPAHSKTATIRKLFRRLHKGPFWLGDWKSTGIGSRSTANDAIQFLYKRGILKRTPSGHKVMYQLIPHDLFDCKISDWWPYLTTARERDQIERDRDNALKTWAPDFLDKIRPNINAIGRIGTLKQEDSKRVGVFLSDDEIIRLINEVDKKLNFAGILERWVEVQSFRLCLECLAKRNKFARTETDHESGEIVCTECALVVTRDPIQRTRDSRPSPFSPPR